MQVALKKLEKAYNFIETCHLVVRDSKEEETACIGDVLIAAMNYVTEAIQIIEKDKV